MTRDWWCTGLLKGLERRVRLNSLRMMVQQTGEKMNEEEEVCGEPAFWELNQEGVNSKNARSILEFLGRVGGLREQYWRRGGKKNTETSDLLVM